MFAELFAPCAGPIGLVAHWLTEGVTNAIRSRDSPDTASTPAGSAISERNVADGTNRDSLSVGAKDNGSPSDK
jgi:hypothetical protein